MDLLCFFSVLCLLCLCTRLFICALWSPAGKGLTSWLSFVMSYCEFVTFPLVSWVRYGTWLYRFLIFAPLLILWPSLWWQKEVYEFAGQCTMHLVVFILLLQLVLNTKLPKLCFWRSRWMWSTQTAIVLLPLCLEDVSKSLYLTLTENHTKNHIVMIFYSEYLPLYSSYIMSNWPPHFFKLNTDIKWICALKVNR